VVFVLGGLFMVAAGRGLRRRERRGRRVALVLGGLGGLVAGLCLLWWTYVMREGEPSTLVTAVCLAGLVVGAAYCALTYGVLLPRRAAGEFS
jgi:hypothetical protein